jgi:signal transduction histidine kinase/CheY-like chemotaxis protein
VPHSSVLTFKGPDSTSRATAVLGLIVVAVLVAVVAVATWQYRSHATEAAHAAAENLSFALAVHAQQAIHSADYVAEEVQRSIVRRQLSRPEDLTASYAGEAEHQWLRSRHTSFGAINVVNVVDAQGRLVNTSFAFPSPPTVFDDREAFIAVRDRHVSSHVSGPIVNRFDGRWTIYLSRPLEDAQGRFMGAVLVGLSPSYFIDFYAGLRMDRVKPQPDVTAMTLLRSDRTVMARAPDNDEVLGRRLSATGAYAAIPASADSDAVGSQAFEPWDARPASPGEVVLAWQAVPGHPLNVAVALRDDLYLAQWRKQATGTVLFATVAVVLLGGTFTALVRVLRRRERYLQDVERLRATAEAASRAKTNFLATVSHEVRTPLNGILGTADLLVRSGLRPREHELAGTLLTSGRNLLAIINDILDLSRIEADELQLNFAPFLPRSLVHDVLNLFAPYATSKGLGLSMHADNQVPTALKGDAQRVKQVLGNLVSNAIKFSDRGEVRVNVLWPAGEDGTGVLRLEVCDQGVGIPDEARERLFQPFAQADSSISRRFGGTGLGLAISKRLISLMGGRIDFDSADGGGTRFWVELPLPEHAGPVADGPAHHEHSDWTFAHSGAMPLAPAQAQVPRSQARSHVLVVEDNSINAMVVEAQLQRLGCSCDIAVDGEEALQRLGSDQHYDLVLMDCMLPGISGFEATLQWRAIEKERDLPRLPIVALTANALASNLEQTRAAGMDDFLTKPCTLDKLDAVVRHWLKDHAAEGADVGPS